MTYRIGIDIGGTFTDFALFDDESGATAIHKRLTTPRDPSRSVLDGVSELLERENVRMSAVSAIVHGSTLVTNAVIERKGATTGMLVTSGFRDVLDIALERRYDLFDLRLNFPAPIIPRALRVEVAERIRWDGSVEHDLDLGAVRSAIADLVARHNIEALAVCFLHSFTNPSHEQAVVSLVREEFPDLFVSASSDVLPYMREYERWTTTGINAFTQPLVDRYLMRLESGLTELGFEGNFLVMTSSGGTVTTDTARRYPVRMLESGPAAGALMSAFIGRLTDRSNLLSFDMGGTTAKGAIIRQGAPMKRYDMEVARVHEFKPGSGLPVKIPVIDMIEIGAGGGSIANIDDRGVIKVGPKSAGAEPGPACYGRGGDRPTLTDANLILGYLDDRYFLGGSMSLDGAAAERTINDKLAQPLDLDAVRAAWGIHEVINEDVARAFRVHASERGFDYRGCSMVAFGGGGPIHALRIARKLRIPRVILPVGAGVMSALGMLASPLSFEVARTDQIGLSTLTAATFAAKFSALIAEASELLVRAGVKPEEIKTIKRLDMRYRGQGYEVEVTLPADRDYESLLPDLSQYFADAYAKVFSLSFIAEPVEIVNWKVEAIGPEPAMGRHYGRGAKASVATQAKKGVRRAYFPESGGFIDCPVYDRYSLRPGEMIVGPALIEERESTAVIGAGDSVVLDERGNLVAEIHEASQAVELEAAK